MTEGIEQLLQVVNLLGQLATYVGIGYTHTMGRHLNYLRCRLDVGTFLYGIKGRRERLVLNEYKSTAMVDKCVSGYARLLMISLREASVNNHKLAVGLDRILAIAYMYGHMTVDNMTIFAFHPESVHYIVDYLLIVAQLEVVALLLVVCRLVGYEVALEGSHLRLIEQRAVRSTPQI